MKAVEVSVGDRFGRWTVVGSVCNRRTRCICRCDCGAEKTIQHTTLTKGLSKSCGCYRREFLRKHRETHGASGTAEYKIWAGMRKRCSNTRTKSYADYGGRGITVCVSWSRFESFIADVGPRPTPKHSLDRIDVNGNYEPGNVRWATATEQVRNRRPRKPSISRINEILAAHGLCF